MAKKLGDYKGFGVEGNLLNVGDWGGIVGAGFAVLTGFAISQGLFKKAGKHIPKFDSTIDPVFDQPRTETGIRKRYL